MFETLFRDALLEAAQADQADLAAGVYRLSFASEGAKVLRRDKDGAEFLEVLSMAPGDADLSLLNTCGILLANHDEHRQIGTVVPGSARVDADRKARASVRVTHPDWLQRLASDRSMPPISVGYIWTRLVRTYADKDTGLTVRVYAWRGFEVSMLTCLPADNTVGIGRSLTHDFMMTRNSYESVLALALSGSRKIEDRFTRESLRQDYSMRECIASLGRAPAGLVREVHESSRYIGGNIVAGRFTRFECALPRRAARDSQATIFQSGGAMIQTDMHPAIELLHNRNSVVKLGGRVVPGLKGHFVAPRIASSANVQNLSEIAGVAQSQIVTEQLALAPCRGSAQIIFSKQLLMQSDDAAEDVIRSEIASAVNVIIDRAALKGSGFASEPLGIMQTPGIASVTFGGAADFPHVLAFEKALADSNADAGSLGWVLSPATRLAWAQKSRIAATNYPSFILENDRVLGRPVVVTNNMADTNQALFGNFQDVWILVWGDGLDILSDPITSARTGETIVTVILWYNILVRHPQSFCMSIDSASQ